MDVDEIMKTFEKWIRDVKENLLKVILKIGRNIIDTDSLKMNIRKIQFILIRENRLIEKAILSVIK